MIELKETMLQIVEKSFFDEQMKELVTSFIDFKEKEGFRFAELVLFHYELFGGKSGEIVRIAAGMELLILAIDIFDDLVDEDNPNPPWMKQASSTATHIAMALLIASQKAIDESRFDNAVKQQAKKMFNDHTLRCIYGQEHDARNEIHNESDYVTITKEKSGSLISCACLVGAIFAKFQQLQNVKDYAEHFGIAVQIANDISDIQQENSKNDFLHKKKTLPVLYLLHHNAAEFLELKSYYEGNIPLEHMKAKQKEIVSMIQKSGAIEYAQVIMQLEISKSKKVINSMDISEDGKKSIQSMLFR
ncbi:MAG TPA: polyprenyl synthetase [Bacillus bacterium]|nr:polyprenyl synthetase [Bacillus sp. (in: firmicutes)]